MTFYTEMAQVAADLLTEFGTTLTLTRYTNKVPSPTSTGTSAAGTSTTYSPKGIAKRIPAALIDGTRIRTDDRMLILDNTVEPIMGDEVTWNGSTWNIVEITLVKPTDTGITYEVLLRK